MGSELGGCGLLGMRASTTTFGMVLVSSPHPCQHKLLPVPFPPRPANHQIKYRGFLAAPPHPTQQCTPQPRTSSTHKSHLPAPLKVSHEAGCRQCEHQQPLLRVLLHVEVDVEGPLERQELPLAHLVGREVATGHGRVQREQRQRGRARTRRGGACCVVPAVSKGRGQGVGCTCW
jgi:hypothetical protein